MFKKSQTNLYNNTQRQQNSSSLIKTRKGFDKLNLKECIAEKFFLQGSLLSLFYFYFIPFQVSLQYFFCRTEKCFYLGGKIAATP